jgi:hypothetical protein
MPRSQGKLSAQLEVGQRGRTKGVRRAWARRNGVVVPRLIRQGLTITTRQRQGHLLALRVGKRTAILTGISGKSYWHLSRSQAMHAGWRAEGRLEAGPCPISHLIERRAVELQLPID